MTRILAILIMVCMGCTISAHAAKPAPQEAPVSEEPAERQECGPSGLIQVLEIEDIAFIRLQKGCYLYEDGKVVGFEDGDDEILTANEAGRYELPFEGAYFYFQGGKPHLSYLKGDERRNAILSSKGDGVFTYSAYLKTLRHL